MEPPLQTRKKGTQCSLRRAVRKGFAGGAKGGKTNVEEARERKTIELKKKAAREVANL